MQNKIDRPIFIIGVGRSGTTILYNLLSIHPELCWFSRYSDIFPRNNYIALLHKSLELPYFGNLIKKSIISRNQIKILPIPSEGGNIYHNYCGFEHKYKTTEFDYNLESEKKLKKVIQGHIKATGKKRFLSKQTANTQRIRLIHKMFPDGFYIHIIRDGRAVANSLVNVEWWKNIDIWWFNGRPSKWVETGNDPIALAGLIWERDVDEIIKNKNLFDNKYFELRYEDLCDNPKKWIKNIADFCEISWPTKLEDILPKKLVSMNDKWKKNLSEKQKMILLDTIKKSLKKYNYETEDDI